RLLAVVKAAGPELSGLSRSKYISGHCPIRLRGNVLRADTAVRSNHQEYDDTGRRPPWTAAAGASDHTHHDHHHTGRRPPWTAAAGASDHTHHDHHHTGRRPPCTAAAGAELTRAWQVRMYCDDDNCGARLELPVRD